MKAARTINEEERLEVEDEGEIKPRRDGGKRENMQDQRGGVQHHRLRVRRGCGGEEKHVILYITS